MLKTSNHAVTRHLVFRKTRHYSAFSWLSTLQPRLTWATMNSESSAQAVAPARDFRLLAWAVLGLITASLSAVLGTGAYLRLDAGVALAAARSGGPPMFIAAILGSAAHLLLATVLPDALWPSWIAGVATAGLTALLVERATLMVGADADSPAWLLLICGICAALAAATSQALVGFPDLGGRGADAILQWTGLLAGTLGAAALVESMGRPTHPLLAIGGLVLFAVVLAMRAIQPDLPALPSPYAALLVALSGFTGLLLTLRRQSTAALAMILAVATLALAVGPEQIGGIFLTTAGSVILVLMVQAEEGKLAQFHETNDQNRQLFDSMMRFLPVGLFRVEVGGDVRYTNPEFQALTGLSSNSLRGWVDIVHDADRESVQAKWRRFQNDGEEFNGEFRLRDVEPIRWLAVHVAAESAHGDRSGYIGTVQDITMQRAAADARDRSEAQSRAVLDTAVDAIVTMTTDERVLTFNQAAQTMFGYTRAEVIGNDITMLMPEPHKSHHAEYVKNYLDTGDGKIIGIGRELEARRKDGSLVPIYLAVSEVWLDGQRTFTGIMRDVSRQRAAEEAIRRQHEELNVTVQNAPMGIVTYPFDGCFSSTNKSFQRITGLGAASLGQLRFVDLVHPDNRAEWQRLTGEAKRGRLQQYSQQLQLTRKDGISIQVIIHNAVTHDSHGHPERVVAQVEDLTGAIRAEEAEREHQEKLTHVARLSTLGEMTAGIAHEINQPLTAISMYAQSGVRMLDAGIPNPDKLREALEKLNRQSLRAGEVIDRMQRLVRHRESEREPVLVNDLVNDLLRLAESDARMNGMQIRLNLAKGLPVIHVDPIQVQQVLLNLIRNGIDAMQQIGCKNGNEIEIATKQVGERWIEVSVCDAGTGVSAEFEPSLFTPFATTKTTGMGMGLSICNTIIKTHGGTLGHHNNDDHGATFRFQLPVEGVQ
jgi:two-component system sensor kinase FixL